MLGRGVVGVLQPPQSGAMASQVGLPDHGGGGENGEEEQEEQWRQDERGQKRRALEETEVGVGISRRWAWSWSCIYNISWSRLLI